MSKIFDTITEFNKFYSLPCPDKPTTAAVGDLHARIVGFTRTMRDELSEGLDIIDKLNNGAGELEILTDLADWYLDLVVYSLSEAAKFGIPSEKVLQAIMESNFSKKQADGSVLKDSSGKVLKGPLYVRPEPMIEDIVKEAMK